MPSLTLYINPIAHIPGLARAYLTPCVMPSLTLYKNPIAHLSDYVSRHATMPGLHESTLVLLTQVAALSIAYPTPI